MSVTARVKVTLEIVAKSNWDDDVMASQVKKQATEDALGELNRLANDAGGRIKIVGKPEVTMVMFDTIR